MSRGPFAAILCCDMLTATLFNATAFKKNESGFASGPADPVQVRLPQVTS